MNKIIILLIVILSFESSADYQSDSIIVRAILDSNGLSAISVDSVSGKNSSGIDTLRLIGGGASQNIPTQIQNLPKEIGGLTNLEYLNLEFNNIKVIPRTIGQLLNLKSLNLHHNEIQSIPHSEGDLLQLVSLIISDNLMSSLPNAVGALANLRHLHVSNNNLTRVPNSITEITGLTHLCLDNNNLTTLPRDIGNLLNLETLRLDSNLLSGLPNSVTGLYFGPDTVTRELVLDWNELCNLSADLVAWADSNDPGWFDNQRCDITGTEINITNNTLDYSLNISPNPFNSVIKINLVPNPNIKTSLKIYEVSGKLIDSFQAESNTGLIWHPGILPNGVYIIRANVDGKIFSKKVLLQR
jgi:Leucine-rich repeat (LRR) protein